MVSSNRSFISYTIRLSNSYELPPTFGLILNPFNSMPSDVRFAKSFVDQHTRLQIKSKVIEKLPAYTLGVKER